MNLNFLEKKWFLYLIYVMATFFFIFQHFKGVSWDFMVYSMNGQYLFGDKFFFEWARPPLSPLLIGVFGFLGHKISEFFYVILVAFLHFLSSVLLANKFKINKNYFYILSLSFFVLINGLNVGTELLSLSLLQFFLVFFGRWFSIIFLGLMFLTRYTNLMFLSLILFNKNFKLILGDIGIFLLTIFPWFLYNYFETGNFLYGFVNSYALNVVFRDYYFMAFNFGHLIFVMNFLIPFFVLGLLLKFRNFKKIDFMMLFIFILVLISYIKVPYKTPRYLFLLVLPVIYYSCIFMKRFKFRKIVLISLILLNLFTLFSINYLYEIDDVKIYQDPLNYVNNCSLMSNVWIHFNYLGREAEPSPWKSMVERSIEEGKVIVLFKSVGEPDYVKDSEFLSKFNIIKETESYIILGSLEDCKPKEPFVDHYLLRYKENNKITFIEEIDISNCGILFKGKLREICKITKII